MGWVRAKYYREENRREPEEISETLGAILERVGTDVDRHAGTLVADWPAIAPSRWVELGKPVGIRRRVLLVEAPSGAAATVLRHDTAALLSRISDRFGPGVVKAVSVRVSGGSKSRKTP